jgi:hypothetical protein
MTKTFTGAVMLPGEAGTGLEATLSLGPERVTLSAGDNQLGSWDRADYLITPESNGAFGLTLGGETLLFRPDSPSEFSSTSAVPMAEPLLPREERVATVATDTVTTEDDYIEAAITGIRPLKDPTDDGGLSKGFVAVMSVLATLVCLAAIVTAALV